MRKKILLLLPFLLWAILIFVEWLSLFFQYPKPMYFRAWEYVINQGKDSYYVPFKPYITYHGKLYGDLIKFVNFTPKKSEIYWQNFSTDEYGFRNMNGLLDKPIDAVLLGTSFVGGAHETQENLVNEILYKKYQIKAYNYATLPMQHFWEDKRFIKNKPKYAIVIINESEAMQNTWAEVLQESKTTHSVAKWSSYKEWENENYQVELSFDAVSKFVKRFSLIRYLSQEIFTGLLNTLLSRDKIAYQFVISGVYDPKKDMLFYDINSFDPTYNIKSKKSIDQTVATLLKTQAILRKREIKLVVAIMPSKSHIYAKKYEQLPIKKSSLFVLQQNLQKNAITYINLQALTLPFKDNPQTMLYYRQDGHWTSIVNRILAEEINKIIKNDAKSDKLF